MRAAFAVALAGLTAAPVPAGDPVTWDQLRPVLAKHCLRCHSTAAKKVKAEFDLDTREALLRGSTSGQVVVPGKPSESLLSQVVRADGSPHMPPKGQLTPKEIAVLDGWIAGLPKDTPVGAEPANKGADHWAFRPPVRPAVPPVKNEAWPRGPIDRFVLAKLEANDLSPAPPAAKADLLRRAYFDLTGLPPSPEDVKAFLANDSPDAFAKVVDALLASPAYGERWGRHWLDLARYADTGGFHNDLERPNAWRYRDYVVRSFNADKPYPRFVKEQLAGDEFVPGDPDALIATGFGRNGPSNDDNMGKTAKDREKYRLDELDGVISTTSSVFLGLTLGCARCHDHKYDPITQADYYRTLAVFNTVERKDLPLTAEKNPKAAAMALVDGGPTPRPTRLLWRGDVGNPGPEVEPAVPGFLGSVSFPPPAGDAKSTGRRLAYAEWVTSPANPLTYRVLANRVWQHHFGRGIVATPGNFGRSGAEPSHPELLDYLATDLAASDGRLKPLHRAILLSATYQQSSRIDPKVSAIDPDNAMLARQNKRRLEAEAIRDGILAAAGSLNPKAGGPGVKPRIRPDLLPASQRNKWPTVKFEGPEQWRRSVYIYAKRQLLFPMMELFDAPTTTDVCDRRIESVVPTQALLLMNDEFVDDQAARLAARATRDAGPSATPAAVAERALWLALSRPPSAVRVTEAVAFVEQLSAAHREAKTPGDPDALALADLCHVLFNCNEFAYLD